MGHIGGCNQCVAQPRQRQCEAKFTTAPDHAGHLQRAAHRSHQTSANGQAQSGAAVLTADGRIALRKLVKNNRLLGHGNTNAGVAHAEAQGQLVIRFLHGFNAQQDVTMRRKFDGVRGQIDEHLLQAQRIAHQLTAGRRLGFNDQLEVFRLCLSGHDGGHVVQQIA